MKTINPRFYCFLLFVLFKQKAFVTSVDFSDEAIHKIPLYKKEGDTILHLLKVISKAPMAFIAVMIIWRKYLENTSEPAHIIVISLPVADKKSGCIVYTSGSIIF